MSLENPPQQSNFFLNPVAKLGRATLVIVYFWGDYSIFIGKIIYRTFARKWRGGLIFQQCLEIGVKSFPIAMLTSVFVGMVMVVQTGYQLIKFGAKGYVPGIAFIANAREMVPAFCAMVVGARVAASITAEIGTMKVTEQLDAMDVLDVDPIRYLCVPRVIAMTIMLPAICAICLVTGFLAGMVVSDVALNIPPLSYYNTTLKFAKVSDVMGGLAKTVVFGTLIALTGCYYGFRTSGGAAGVGRATTNSVVLTLILILVFDYLLSSFILALFMPF